MMTEELNKNTKVTMTCNICGKQLTKNGYNGHMRFKHGKDPKAPMLDVTKPISYNDIRKLIFVINDGGYKSPCCSASIILNKADVSNPDKLKGLCHCPECGKQYTFAYLESIDTLALIEVINKDEYEKDIFEKRLTFKIVKNEDQPDNRRIKIVKNEDLSK
jgi:hypothetical protein